MRHLPTNSRLVIAGPDEGGYRQQIDRLISQHGVADRTQFVGMLRGEQKLQAIADADVLAAPSAHENFGIAVAEAIALGTFVAVSDQVGLLQQILAHHVGIHLPLQADPCGQALADLLDRRRRQGAQALADESDRARTLARQWFAWPAIAQNWIDQYGAALAGR
jgi:glycosyltransferase involved in cell wall biosynthesis